MPSCRLRQINKFIQQKCQNTAKYQSSNHFPWRMSHPFFQKYFRFLFLQDTLYFMPQCIDILCMFTGLIPQIHGVIRDEKHKDKRHSKKDTIESLIQIDKRDQTTRHTAMYRRKSSGSKKIFSIKMLVLSSIDHQFDKLDDNDHQKRYKYWIEWNMHKMIYTEKQTNFNQ